MMKAQANRRTVAIAAVVAGILIPQLGIAEYDSLPSYNAATSSGIGKAQSALNPASSALSGAAGKSGSNVVDNLRADLAEKVAKAQKDIEVSKKETDLRKKVDGWKNDIDKLKTGLALPDILAQNKLKQREDKNKRLQSLFNSMGQTTQGLQAGALDTSKLGDACRTNLDFSQFRALAEQLKTEPFQYLKREGTKIIDERNEETKKKKIEVATKLAAHFENLSKQPVGAGQEAAQQDITQGKIDFVKRDNSLDVRLAGLEKTGDAQKKEIGQLRQELVKKVFSDLLPQLSEANDNDSKVQAIVGGFADSTVAMIRAAKEKAIAGASRATANCNKIADHMGRGNPLAPGTLFNAAFQMVSTVNDTYANQQFFQGMQQASTQLKCRDVVQNVDALLGQNLENQAQVVRQITDPKQAIEAAMQLMNSVGGALAQAGDVIEPALRDCKRNEDSMKKVEQYVQGAQQQAQQLASSQQGGGAGGSSGTRSTTSNSAARGGNRGGAANPLNHSRTAPTTVR